MEEQQPQIASRVPGGKQPPLSFFWFTAINAYLWGCQAEEIN